MKKKKFEMEELMTKEKVADFLRKVAEGIEAGCIELQDDEETLTLSPPDIIAVEIDAKQKKDKAKFSMEISWRCPEAVKGV